MRNRQYIIILQFLILLLLGGSAWASGYQTVTPGELKAMLSDKDFFLLDVHIPEQSHITETDAFIDYRKIRQNSDRLPADKKTKIVVYCLGGGMSRKAAFDLIRMGYTRVYDLLGGTWAFNRLKSQ